MIKLIVAITIISCTGLAGYELYKQEQTNAKAIQELYQIVEDIIISIDYLSLDVFEICTSVFRDRKYLDYSAFLNISCGDFPSLWSKACVDTFNGHTCEVFSDIGNILGACDSESQIKKLTYIKESLMRSYEELSVKLNDKRKLYSTISLCVGVLLVLIII